MVVWFYQQGYYFVRRNITLEEVLGLKPREVQISFTNAVFHLALNQWSSS